MTANPKHEAIERMDFERGLSVGEELAVRLMGEKLDEVVEWFLDERPDDAELVSNILMAAKHAGRGLYWMASHELAPVAAYLDNRADADSDSDGPIPNDEMKMLALVNQVQEQLRILIAARGAK